MFLLIMGLSAERPNGRGGRSYVAPWAATARMESKMKSCCCIVVDIIIVRLPYLVQSKLQK